MPRIFLFRALVPFLLPFSSFFLSSCACASASASLFHCRSLSLSLSISISFSGWCHGAYHPARTRSLFARTQKVRKSKGIKTSKSASASENQRAFKRLPLSLSLSLSVSAPFIFAAYLHGVKTPANLANAHSDPHFI